MSYAFDLTITNFGSSENFGGQANTFASADFDLARGSSLQDYGGLASNYDAVNVNNIIGSAGDQVYNGITTNFDTRPILAPQSIQVDNNPILTHPKDQTIYYKVSGYNPNTSSYETWVIAENIVPRPELFNTPGSLPINPNSSPPNVDLGIFYTPPSGNPLIDIKIVGRWIQ